MSEKDRRSFQEDPTSKQSFKSRSASASNRIGDSSTSGPHGSRKMSRLSETVTIISNCEKEPDTCVLCGGGIPSSRCDNCENEAHNRCIEAFFCTIGKKVDLNSWRCPKCVTINNMHGLDTVSETKSKEESIASQVELARKLPDPDCPFCKFDMDLKNCRCEDCVESLKKSMNNKCYCAEGGMPPIFKHNKCLQFREFGTNFEYKNLSGDDEDLEYEDEDAEENGGNGGSTRICWAIAWFLLLVPLAFLIAIISSFVFIIVYCFEACCKSCHPVSCFFLAGIKLPGTCCRGICTGDPMCGGSEPDCEKI